MASFKELIEKNSLVLVDFSAEWCGPCQTLSPILKDVKEHFGDKRTVLKIDVDKNNALARSFSVQGVPTLILYKSSEQVWRQSGLITKSELTSLIVQHLN